MEEGAAFAAVVDAHAHPTDFLPSLPRRIYRAFLRRTIPPPVPFAAMHAAGTDAIVAAAVGDPVVTMAHLKTRWRAVGWQLRHIRTAARDAGLAIALEPGDIRAGASGGTGSVILGIEGADVAGRHLDRFDRLEADGVRIITPVHLRHNRIGTTSLPWHSYMKRLALPGRRRRGLTKFGAAAVTRMNELGILIDVSHADTPTLMGIVAASTQPVVASHSGARAVEGFARNLSDAEMRAIVTKGGLIGLWPYHYAGEGPATLDDLMAHARHIAAVVGAEHICVGTDHNGVPGVTQGTGAPDAMAKIGAALGDAGFTPGEVRGILGENFLRVFTAVRNGRRGAGAFGGGPPGV